MPNHSDLFVLWHTSNTNECLEVITLGLEAVILDV